MTDGWIDIGHPFWAGMPKLELLPEVELDTYMKVSEGSHVTSSTFIAPLHAGTHIDAPNHIIAGGKSFDEIPADRFKGSGVVASVRRKAGELVTVQDLLEGGPEPEAGDMLFIHTGWGELFDSAEYHDHPSLDPEVAEWAVERGLSLVGLDCLTPDVALPRRENPPDLTVHRTLLGNEILIAENLTGLGRVPPQRLNVYAFPIVVRGGDAGHARIFVEPQ